MVVVKNEFKWILARVFLVIVEWIIKFYLMNSDKVFVDNCCLLELIFNESPWINSFKRMSDLDHFVGP